MKKIFLAVYVVMMIFGSVSGANAIPVNIDLTTPMYAYGEDTSQAVIEGIIAPLMVPSTELYKAEPVTGAPALEFGLLAGSYQTSFSPDNEMALIEYVGGPYVGPIAYLLAKDGSANDQNPATHGWYLYNLTALGWTGTESIFIDGLWPEQGSFSHVTLYGGAGTVVPEPATILLLGLGLISIAVVRKKF